MKDQQQKHIATPHHTQNRSKRTLTYPILTSITFGLLKPHSRFSSSIQWQSPSGELFTPAIFGIIRLAYGSLCIASYASSSGSFKSLIFFFTRLPHVETATVSLWPDSCSHLLSRHLLCKSCGVAGILRSRALIARNFGSDMWLGKVPLFAWRFSSSSSSSMWVYMSKNWNYEIQIVHNYYTLIYSKLFCHIC